MELLLHYVLPLLEMNLFACFYPCSFTSVFFCHIDPFVLFPSHGCDREWALYDRGKFILRFV